MPRTITPAAFAVYTLDELDERARARAIDYVAEKRWWDRFDNGQIGETLVAAFAQRLGSPGWDEYGVSDFPGIPGVELFEWSMDRSQELTFKGTLTRDNAPALPWADGIEEVALEPRPDYGIKSRVNVQLDVERERYGQDEALRDAARKMAEAVESALDETWQAGYAEMEYMCGEEAAEEDIRVNGREFYADGSLYS